MAWYVAAAVVVAALAYALTASNGGPLSSQGQRLNALQVQTSTYGMTIPVVFGTGRISGNLIYYGDFKATAHDTGGGKGGGGGPKTYTYSTAFAMGICEGPIVGIGKNWSSKEVHNSLLASLTLFEGTYPQTPWSYFTTETLSSPSQLANPGWKAIVTSTIAGWAATGSPLALTKDYIKQVGYPGIAYVAASNFDLGYSNSLPNLSFEVQGFEIVTGTDDANPADIITFIVTDEKAGLGLPSALVELSDYYNYCMAADLLLSPIYSSQESAATVIKLLCDTTNSEVVWHDGEILTIVPYGDIGLTGNGVTWTPDLTPKYDLNDDDFLGDNSQDPIKIIRGTPADAFNQVVVEYINRDKNYDIDTEKYQDQSYVDLYGLRPDETKTLHAINRKSVAQSVCQLLCQRNIYIRNKFEFTLGWKYVLLEPMDIVTINDAAQGLVQHPVRIVGMEENDNGEWLVKAEDLTPGSGNSKAYNSLGGSGFVLNHSIDPGNVNTPVIFNAPGALTVTGREIWAAISGGADWGGCQIYVASESGGTYKYIGQLSGRSRHGVLTAALGSGSDPDTTNTCSVNLTVSQGELLSGTQDDADDLHTLCLVGDELISYQTATLTAEYNYDLTYLRRGCYNSAIASHQSPYPRFVRLDDKLFKYPFDKSMEGKTLYFKFLSFNKYGGGLQSLADVTAISYTIGAGLSYPSNVTGFSASQSGGVVSFIWTPVTDVGVVYELRYNASGDHAWTSGTVIVQNVTSNNYSTTTIPAGAWSFMVCAKDQSGNYSLTPAVYDLTVLSGGVSGDGNAQNWFLGT